MDEYPLPHEFLYTGQFDLLDAAKNSTILTVLRSSESVTGIDLVEVNPRNNAFQEETGPTIANRSIVPRISFTLRASLSQAMLLDNEFAKVQFHMMPIYTAFLSSLDAEDDDSGLDIEEILELTHAVGAKRVEPLYATKLSSTGTQPLNTILEAEALEDYGLTTTAVMENVAWNLDDYFDCLSYYTNSGMMRKVTGPIKTWTLTRDRTATYHSNNFTNPIVKRGNAYTYCGVLIWVGLPGAHSFGVATDFDAADKDIIHWNSQIRFDEWNSSFDQTVS